MAIKSSYDIIKNLLRTEKASAQEPLMKYLFLVNSAVNKIEIKRAVEDIYKVKVQAVNTVIAPGKLRRMRYQAGYQPDLKKAWVTLKEGSKIDIT